MEQRGPRLEDPRRKLPKPSRQPRRVPNRPEGETTRRTLRLLGAMMALGLASGGAALTLRHPEWAAAARDTVGGGLEWRKSIHRPPMPLQKLMIASGPHTPRAAVERLVRRQGSDLWAMNLEHLRAECEALPWVASATVERLYPGTLSLRLKEKEAVALVREPALAWIDAWGEIIDAAPVESLDRYPVIRIGDETADRSAAMEELIGWLRRLEAAGILSFGEVSEAAVDAAGIRVMTSGGLAMRFPRRPPEGMESSLAAVLAKFGIDPLAPGRATGVRLEADGRAWVRADDGSGTPDWKI